MNIGPSTKQTSQTSHIRDSLLPSDQIGLVSGERMEWQLQHAKSRLSELIASADVSGPQVITVRGQRKAVVLSAAEYERLNRGATLGSLVQFFRDSPLGDDVFEVERDKDTGREVDL
tara:strand:+ start:1791 stop:2141 length:351 start_codon:yes stop_codon:yes gene_type:complete